MFALKSSIGPVKYLFFASAEGKRLPVWTTREEAQAFADKYELEYALGWKVVEIKEIG